jgi:hypothetical protein
VVNRIERRSAEPARAVLSSARHRVLVVDALRQLLDRVRHRHHGGDVVRLRVLQMSLGVLFLVLMRLMLMFMC